MVREVPKDVTTHYSRPTVHPYLVQDGGGSVGYSDVRVYVVVQLLLKILPADALCIMSVLVTAMVVVIPSATRVGQQKLDMVYYISVSQYYIVTALT